MSEPAASKPARRRRRRGSINADDIVAGAFEVARRVSLDRLSMPTLAAHLDVGVTSIYWYFRKKDDLLDTMADAAVAAYADGMPAVNAGGTWQETLSGHFHAQRGLHREDRVLSDLLLMRASAYSPESLRRVAEIEEAVVGRLVDAGFTAEDARRAYRAASVYTRGMIIHDRMAGPDGPAPPGSPGGPVAAHPLAGMTDEDFDFGMRRLIGGLEALPREGSPEDAPARRGRAAPRPGAARAEHADRSRRATG
ncbi:TetR/AcrR family transcriptional regulator [Actinomadura rugatobispora]|uniref:TetR/AcrR family transcriptional regulator n=1 Tax=Actinomadura rugatobispora TaxID=1994 RepID=A0ABW0ZWB6_9ACTN|nr:hypothetical protein GCM10010200_110480 [Actinomadura rugatobispora]